jgi:signal transduction histidine kinase
VVDPARFRQLLLNLLDNAVKFGPPGQRVQVTLARMGDRCRLSIADHGSGVTPAERDRIWEPYYRGGAAESRAVGGSGIGLAIVRDTANGCGGQTWVEETPGGGATFVVELPVADTGARPVATANGTSEGETAEPRT